MFDNLIDAAQRSVQIDILWGQTEPEEQNKLESYKNVIAKFDELNNKIVQKGLSTQIKFHRTPLYLMQNS